MSRRLSIEIAPELDGRKIRSVLQTQLGLSAGLVTRLKHREGAVLLNGLPAKTLDSVRAGDVLSVEVGDGKEGGFAPAGPRLSVLWEDEDILIIDKPGDMAVHGRSERGEPTVGSAVAAYLGSAAPFHPVNRLDRGTTGAMCAAKTGYMHERLRRLLHTPGLRREYLAISVGVPEPASGASGSGGAEGAPNAADSGAEDAAGVDAGWAQPVKKSVNASSTATVRFIGSAPFHLSDIEVPEKPGFSAPRREFSRAGAARIKSAVSRQQ